MHSTSIVNFVREVGAIDNATYRQLDSSITHARARLEIHKLCDLGFIEKKGQGRSTYYIRTSKVVFLGERLRPQDERLRPQHGTLGEKIPPQHGTLGKKIPPQHGTLDQNIPPQGEMYQAEVVSFCQMYHAEVVSFFQMYHAKVETFRPEVVTFQIGRAHV